jgi:ribonuclease VapC
VIVDSSAIVAIVLREPGWEGVVARLGAEAAPAIGALTLAEVGLVLTAKMGAEARIVLSRLLQGTGLTVIPFADEHWRVAVDAYARFGKGRHPAALNFGDCLTYALTRLAGPPLLVVGDDSSKTDLPSVWLKCLRPGSILQADIAGQTRSASRCPDRGAFDNGWPVLSIWRAPVIVRAPAGEAPRATPSLAWRRRDA